MARGLARRCTLVSTRQTERSIVDRTGLRSKDSGLGVILSRAGRGAQSCAVKFWPPPPPPSSAARFGSYKGVSLFSLCKLYCRRARAASSSSSSFPFLLLLFLLFSDPPLSDINTFRRLLARAAPFTPRHSSVQHTAEPELASVRSLG